MIRIVGIDKHHHFVDVNGNQRLLRGMAIAYKVRFAHCFCFPNIRAGLIRCVQAAPWLPSTAFDAKLSFGPEDIAQFVRLNLNGMAHFTPAIYPADENRER